MTTKPSCAALHGNNTRCEKAAQCARAVSWFEDLRAGFNLCSPHGHGTFKKFQPLSRAPKPTAPSKPQMDLFA